MNWVTSRGDDVWIASNNGTVYKTTATPSPVTAYNVGSANNLYSVYFVDANTGFACGDLGSVYKTINGGVNWSASNAGITGGKLNSICFRDNNNGTVVGNTGYIYVTSDGGSFWSLQTSGTILNLLKVKYFNDSLVAAGEYGKLLVNTGSGWTSISTRSKTDIRGISGPDMNNVRICGGGGFIRNNKSGSSNFMNFEMNPMMANLVDIFYYDNNKAWAVSSLNSVIILTTNGGTNWSMPAGSTVTFNWVVKSGASGNYRGNNISSHPVNRDVIFTAFGNKVYRSSNRGENWAQVGTNMPTTMFPHNLYVSPLDTNIWLLAVVPTSGSDKILRTTDYGATWNTVLTKNFSSYGEPLEIDQNNPHVFYFAPDGGGFYKSTDDGATFSDIAGNYPFRSPCEILVTYDSSEIIMVGDGVTSASEPARMFRSSNGGVNWVNIDSTTSSETPSMCNSVFDRNVIWCTEWSGANIYKSTNMGASFSLHHNTGFQGWGSDICREDPTMVITGSWQSAATLSSNGGQSWVNISTGLSGTGGGIYIPERGFALASQGTNIYKLNIVYTNTVSSDSLDVLPTSLGITGSSYFSSTTITPTGTVKNNSGLSTATFTVTRKITPGGYVSTKTVSGLLAGTSIGVTYDPWTFTSSTLYTVKDSVYLSGDTKTTNDVLTGTLTPYFGISTTLLNEPFAGVFPPTGWGLVYTGTNYWVKSVASAYGSGSGSAEYNFYNANGTGSQSLVTQTMASATAAGDSLQYDYAYAPYNNGTTDSLIIETSSDGGTNYTTLVTLYGKNTASGIYSLNTAGQTGSEFSPSSAQWLNKKWGLPAGTNKVKFRAHSGFGNNLFLDNIFVSTNKVFTQYNIKLAPEGMYNGITLNLRDSVKAYLRNIVSPFSIVDTAAAVIDSVTLTAPFVFKNVSSGTYYIQIEHRNGLEMWSTSGGQAITRGLLASYDFTSSQSQTYGSNSVLVGSKYCMFSGDLDRNGSISLTDIIEVFNKSQSFTNGYVPSDLNGDNVVTLSDIIIVFNNSSKFVTKITPETSLLSLQSKKDINKSEMREYYSKNVENYSKESNKDIKVNTSK